MWTLGRTLHVTSAEAVRELRHSQWSTHAMQLTLITEAQILSPVCAYKSKASWSGLPPDTTNWRRGRVIRYVAAPRAITCWRAPPCAMFFVALRPPVCVAALWLPRRSFRAFVLALSAGGVDLLRSDHARRRQVSRLLPEQPAGERYSSLQ
ncbi:hypothetical protein NDU88_006749 [Pleurodeles waltl]|uniref:Uncharacterized protein n=1 Tax=Pleurodeles waltl TaxID=8319 RepID=A0AAV7WH87_PLEWA|nr:hypothetical protein NDU88_006749 [Pleurodeles waltl]